MMDDSTLKSFDEIEYRRALGCFGTGVALVAADDATGKACGLIVNSFTSVSLRPPIVLWCLDEKSGRYDIFADTQTFSVNFLKSGSRSVSDSFASLSTAAFDPADVERMSTGAPVYRQALASLDCSVRWREKAGDHLVIFGTVEAFVDREDGDALGYFRGGYTRLSRDGEG